MKNCHKKLRIQTLRSRPTAQRHRRGTAAVEFAVIAIPLFLFVFGSLEFGRAMMVVQSLDEAARVGCREAILDGSTNQEIVDAIDALLQTAGINQYSITMNPDPPTNAAQWAPVTITVNASIANASWLPLPRYFANKSFTASCTLPREGSGN